MKKLHIKSIIVLTALFCVFSCKDLEELNVNPNGINPETVVPSQMIATVLTSTSNTVVDLGFHNVAGVMQHTQKDAWFDDHNDYDWDNQSWTGYYHTLRDNRHLYDRAEEMDMPFYMGVSLVMKSYLFSLIADLWGDAPYTEAVLGDEGEITPEFTSQRDIYLGVIEDLEAANDLFIRYEDESNVEDLNDDLIYGGDAFKWRRFANSLQLRYYMRISEKEPDLAKSGIEKIMSDQEKYPVILSSADDATMAFAGTGDNNSWPSNTIFDTSSGSNYRRIKMCATLVDMMQALEDPRLAVWAQEIEIPLVVDADLPEGTDAIVDGVRYLSPGVVGDNQIDTDPEYVGLPPSVSSLPSGYNLNPTPGQLSYNPHVSFLNEIYMEASGPLLLARFSSAAEVNFILSEAALKGWSVGGTIEQYYNEGVKASLEAWAVGDSYDAYIAGDASFSGLVSEEEQLVQIITQKWIASWTAATESWFDYRRTGFPELQAGPSAVREALPLRFYYMQDELMLNESNASSAVSNLQETTYTQADGKNSAWARFWLLKDTGKPW